ncbi:MAG: hypothetical protein WDO68_17435 [Gammaproteobacteria bacterium]
MRSTTVATVLAVFALLVSEQCDSDPSPLPESPATSFAVIAAPANSGALIEAAPIGKPGPFDLLLALTLGVALVAVQLRRKEREGRHRKLSA